MKKDVKNVRTDVIFMKKLSDRQTSQITCLVCSKMDKKSEGELTPFFEHLHDHILSNTMEKDGHNGPFLSMKKRQKVRNY